MFHMWRSTGTFCNDGSGRICGSRGCSHFEPFCQCGKQFRFPLEYANQRPVSATWTVTGGGAFILSKDANQPLAKVAGVTTGKIVDYGIKDSMNMGAVMAPAAAELIAQNLTDFKRKPEDYDRIITGDLGEVGQQILFDLLLKKAWISASSMRTVAC